MAFYYLGCYFVNYGVLYDIFNIPLPHVFFVDTHVLLEVSIAWEALLTNLADEWLLSGMLPLVNGEVHFGVIPFHTALVGTPVFVYHLWRTVLSCL